MNTDGEPRMKTVLVIDDMAIFRDPIAASLALAGFKTIKAADGLQGLESLRAHRPDLVLLDLSMPNLDGLSVLRAIRRDPKSNQIPVIMLTALTDRKFIIDAARLGARDYLLKSRFSLTDLIDLVRRSLAAVAAVQDPEPEMPAGEFQAPANSGPDEPATRASAA